MDWYGTNPWSVPSTCTACHTASFSPSLDPTLTNGTGISGKHVKHVQERGIACERCHYGYFYSPTHMNGTYSPAGTPGVDLVSINLAAGPSGTWDPSMRRCSDVACHGSSAMEWYGTAAWTTPTDCTFCHTSSFSSALDPLVTNGSGTSGKHQRHVNDRNYPCVTCHADYPSKTSHANGVLNTGDASTPIVFFNASNPSGQWTNNAGPGSGNCSLLYCHGAYSGTFSYSFPDDGITPVDKTVAYGGSGGTPSWYAAGGLGCDGCHGNPPAMPNSTLKYAWHSGHGGGRQCQLCHPDAWGTTDGIGTAITDTYLHVNGAVNIAPVFVSSCFTCH
jgi:predicted CxxxxCH...CXXCH cytochrome family protein